MGVINLNDSYFLPANPEGTAYPACDMAAVVTLTVDRETIYQKVTGFGGSGCWWAPYSDRYPEDLLNRALELLFDREKGIGLNAYRHNIGGGNSAPANMPFTRQTTCIEVSPGEYDLSNDSTNYKVLKKVASLGIKNIVLFMNSPPSRMTVIGNTCGHPDFLPNLREECFQEYARYCADITELIYRDGIPVKYLSPINEPQWNWGGHSSQEGCYYRAEQVLEIDRLVIHELLKKKIPVKISMPETAAWYDEDYTHKSYREIVQDAFFMDNIDHFSCHSYGSLAEHKLAFANTCKEAGNLLPLYQSEWADENVKDDFSMHEAMKIAKVIHEDLTILSVYQWDWWTLIRPPVTDGAGSLVQIDSENHCLKTPKRFYVLGHYAKFVTGKTRVGLKTEGSEHILSTAYTDDAGNLTVMFTNTSDQPLPVAFNGMISTAKVYQSDDTLSLQYVGELDSANSFELPPCSLTTLVFNR